MELVVILSAIPLLVGQVLFWKGRSLPLLGMMLALAAAMAVYFYADLGCENCDAAGRAMSQGFVGIIGGGLLFLNTLVAALVVMFRPRRIGAEQYSPAHDHELPL